MRFFSAYNTPQLDTDYELPQAGPLTGPTVTVPDYSSHLIIFTWIIFLATGSHLRDLIGRELIGRYLIGQELIGRELIGLKQKKKNRKKGLVCDTLRTFGHFAHCQLPTPANTCNDAGHASSPTLSFSSS